MPKSKAGVFIFAAFAALMVGKTYAVDNDQILFRYKSPDDVAVLTLRSLDLNDLYVGDSVRFPGQASGFGKVKWSSTGNPLPEGLSLSQDGVLSGTPTEAGIYEGIEFTLTDTLGKTVSQRATINVYEPIVSGDISERILVGSASNLSLPVSGGKAPFTYEIIAGDLPDGLSVDGGSLNGTPLRDGVFLAQIRVSDANSRTTTLLAELDTLAELRGSASLADGYLTESLNTSFSVSGGRDPFVWFIENGSLPNGISMSGDGVLTGTPTSAGTFNFTGRVADGSGQFASVPATLRIYSLPSITTSSLSTGTVGYSYSQQLSASGGKAPLSWSISSGSLPSGLSLNSSGRISGTPSSAGARSFQANVSDANGRSASRSLSINVTAPASCSLPWGGTLAHGSSRTAYSASSVPFGSSCQSQTRTCNDGSLSGSYRYSSCSVAAARNCTTPWGTTVLHGRNTTSYQYATVPYGSICQPHQRSCYDGFLGGSYNYGSCTVQPAPTNQNCTVQWLDRSGSSTVAHGTSVTAYTQQESSNCGSFAQTRTCNNGSLSGSARWSTCRQIR